MLLSAEALWYLATKVDLVQSSLHVLHDRLPFLSISLLLSPPVVRSDLFHGMDSNVSVKQHRRRGCD